MPTIRERAVKNVREHTLRVEADAQKLLEALKKTDARDSNDFNSELQKATDEYARAVRELNSK